METLKFKTIIEKTILRVDIKPLENNHVEDWQLRYMYYASNSATTTDDNH